MAYQLTQGAIQEIMTGNQVEKPIFQVLGQKKIAGSGGQNADRYRLLLSDGLHSHSSAMLATQLNHMITDNKIESNAVIQLDKYLCNTIQPDRRVMILLEVQIVAAGSSVGSRIGNPQPFKLGGGGESGGAAAAPKPVAPVPQANVMGGAAAQPRGGASGAATNRVGTPARPGGPASQNAPATPGGTISKVHPISSLTPYQNRWTIRARVTSKSNVRTWSNSRGEGKLFSMNFLDESGEIRATAFKEEVDKFYDMVQVNQVYYISKAQLKAANKQYSSLDNDYEMTFGRDTTMIPCTEDTDLPTVSFNFIPINQLDQHQANANIDVIGVCTKSADLATIIGKQSQKEIKKRDITLVDENRVQVRMTLWGNDAEAFDGSSFPVLAVKGCKLSDWGGRSLSCLSSSQLVLNPDIPEAHRLRGWYDSEGHSADFSEYQRDGGAGGGGGFSTNWKTFGQVKTENLGNGEKADYFTSKATIVFLRKENCMYMACPSQDCNKKVVDQANGMYRCEKCQKEYPNYKWRMILGANLADYTDNQWVTCFQETAETILGRTADELGSLRDTNEVEYDNIFQEANFKSFIFKLRAKMETYNDETRLKTVVVTATPMDYREYNKHLIQNIESMLAA